MAERFVIFDIDGTLFDKSHRKGDVRPTNEQVLADRPIQEVIEIARSLQAHPEGTTLVFSTGRSILLREVTRQQLTEDGLVVTHLLMRETGWGGMSDTDVKQANLKHIDIQNVLCVFEDNGACVDMYRDAGLTVFHCKQPTI